MKKLKWLAVLPLAFTISCASQNYIVHPGAVNTFDSQTYDTLIVTHSVIESTKADLAAGKFPAGKVADGVKAALNALVLSYNVTDTAYLVYHTAAAAGTATATQQAAVTAGIQNINAQTTQLTSAKVVTQ